jgi:hypothetical protein
MELLRLVVAELMEAPSQPCGRKVLILDLQLPDVLFWILVLFSELALLFFLLFSRPRCCLTPFATMFVVVPVVFEAGLACFHGVLDGTVIFCYLLLQHIRKIPTQPLYPFGR